MKISALDSRSAAEASHHHAKRMQNETSPYRNLRLGNFMEEESDELIPDRLRQYYLETYLVKISWAVVRVEIEE